MTIFSLTALAMTAGLPAHAFMASKDLIVEPFGEGRFTVPYRRASGAKKVGLMLWSGERSVRASRASELCEIPRLIAG